MPFIIDGHNLIPHIKGISLTEAEDEVALIRVLQEFARVSRKRVEVFFDKAPVGEHGTRKYGNITAHFVHASSTADAAIIKRVRKLGGAASNWTVVSSDREVQRKTAALRARTMPSGEFAGILYKANISSAADPSQDADLSLDDDEIAFWEDLFDSKAN